MGSVKLKSDGSIEIDPYTHPLRENAVLMLEGLNELIARFDGLPQEQRPELRKTRGQLSWLSMTRPERGRLLRMRLGFCATGSVILNWKSKTSSGLVFRCLICLRY